MPRPLFAILVLIAALAGCNKPLPPPDSPVPQPAAVGPPITIDEAKEFGKKLEAAVASGDEPTFSTLFPFLEMMKQAVSDLNAPPFPPGGEAQMNREFSARIIGMTKKGGTYKFVRVHEVDGRPRALFRFLVPDAGLNYHDVSLRRTAGGQVVAQDALVLLAGESLQQTARRRGIQLLSEHQRSGLTGRDQLFARHQAETEAFTANVRAGKAAEAMATYRAWPAELRKDKVLQLVAVMASAKLGGDEYLKMMEAYRADHPGDPSVEIVSLDYYLLKKQYDDLFKGLDRLQATLGDPYLEYLRATVYLEIGKLSEAKAASEKAIKDEPTLTEAYWARVSVSLTEENHADTLTWLKTVVEERNVELDMGNLAKDKDYAAFVKSPQFKELKKWYAGRANK